MAAEDQEIEVFYGEEVLLTFTHAAGGMTGKTIRFTVARKRHSSTKMIGPVAAVVVNDTTYTVSLDADDTDVQPTKDLNPYFWDAWIIDAENERVIACGDFIVKGSARLPV